LPLTTLLFLNLSVVQIQKKLHQRRDCNNATTDIFC